MLTVLTPVHSIQLCQTCQTQTNTLSEYACPVHYTNVYKNVHSNKKSP